MPLRSLHYFAAAAETSSFSAASRRFGVSVAAVAKLIGNLEQELGTRLFERHAQGLVLTAAGSTYLDACLPALEQLAAADEQASAATSSMVAFATVLTSRLIFIAIVIAHAY